MSQRDIDIKDLNLAESFMKQDDMVEINLLRPHTIPASPYCTTPDSYSNHRKTSANSR